MIPLRLARRLVDRHGKAKAARLVAARLERCRVEREGAMEVTHPFRWLVWGTVLGIVLGVPQHEVASWVPSLRRAPLKLLRQVTEEVAA